MTPTFINAYPGTVSAQQWPVFATLTLQGISVPEPDATLLLVCGAAGLALLARRPRRA